MKAPEEIFNHHASRIMKQFDMDNFKRDYPSLWETIEETLKSMQEDAEKDLIDFVEFIKESDALGGYAWTLLTNEQKVIRFRNKQQDR